MYINGSDLIFQKKQMEKTKNKIQSHKIINHKGSPEQGNITVKHFRVHTSAEDCDYWCNCSVCKGLEKAKKLKTAVNFFKISEDNPERLNENLVSWGGHKVNFNFILERMVSANGEIKGCPIAIPETVLFHKSRPKCVFRFDNKEKEILKINTRHLMQLPNLLKMMTHEFRKRKQNLRVSRRGDLCPEKNTLDSKVNYRGGIMAVVHYFSKENASYLSENEFLELMMERPGSKIWDDILSIQNYIVTPKSSAEILIYKYTAPIDYSNPKKEVVYSLKDFESDEILKETDIYRYAQKICTVIGFYLSKVHNIELLYMK